MRREIAICIGTVINLRVGITQMINVNFFPLREKIAAPGVWTPKPWVTTSKADDIVLSDLNDIKYGFFFSVPEHFVLHFFYQKIKTITVLYRAHILIFVCAIFHRLCRKGSHSLGPVTDWIRHFPAVYCRLRTFFSQTFFLLPTLIFGGLRNLGRIGKP